ncbi:MAG: hypothetical protein N4A71_13310 [Carboxylicivirga sp.]|jgi:hypothetical protein|nr:hypothetical protein [Carboxylicivirga sp.]
MSPNNLVNTSRLYLHFTSFLSSKFGVVCIILLFLLITSAQQNIFAQVPIVSNEQITPLPVISYFDNYEFRVDVAPNGTTINGVSITSTKVNGEDSDHNNPTVSCDYYNNGESYSDGPNVNALSNLGGDIYSYGSLRPDNLYPEIFFTPNGVDYNNSPLDFRPNRNEYHILKFTNPFKMVDNSSLFIELYANPRFRRLSVDLQVYVVGNDEGIDFFQGDDWRSESSAELVGTIKRRDDYNHTHGPNAKHHVVRLLTNDDGTIGTKNINVDGSFWVVLMAPTRFRNRAWTLKYHPKEVNGGRDNDGLVDQALSANATWYRGNFSTWTTTAQSGLPCSHIHIVRDGTDGTDPVKDAIFVETSVDYSYNGTDDTLEETEIFYYNIVPDLPPNASSVLDPEQCAYSSTIDISWVPASDPNGDDLTYNVSVVDLDSKALVKSVATGISTTSVSNFDISDVANGFYDIEVEACDASSCTPFYWTGRYSDDGDFLYLGDNGSLFRSTQSGTWTDYQNWEKNSGDCVWTPASSGEYPSANWAYVLDGHSLTIDDGTTHSLDMYVEGHLSCDMNFTANKVIGLNDASISSSGD